MSLGLSTHPTKSTDIAWLLEIPLYWITSSPAYVTVGGLSRGGQCGRPSVSVEKTQVDSIVRDV